MRTYVNVFVAICELCSGEFDEFVGWKSRLLLRSRRIIALAWGIVGWFGPRFLRFVDVDGGFFSSRGSAGVFVSLAHCLQQSMRGEGAWKSCFAGEMKREWIWSVDLGDDSSCW
jgi:hypothetical protein